MSDFSDMLAEAAREAGSGIVQGAGDIARSAAANIGDTYQTAFLQGRHAPPSQMTADMVTTHSTEDTIGQSYSAAVVEYGRAEGREAEAEHWRQYDAQQPEPPAPSPDAPDI